MFWKKSKSSRSEDNSPIKAKLLTIFRNARQGDVFTLDDLTERTQSPRKDAVAYWLSVLATSQIIDQIVRIVSPKNSGGITEYPTIDQVPNEIFDPYQNKDIRIEPDLIRIYFTRHKDDLSHETAEPPKAGVKA
jgi:hypothetical protein